MATKDNTQTEAEKAKVTQNATDKTNEQGSTPAPAADLKSAEANQKPAQTADASTQGGADKRLENSTSAEEDQAEGKARTHLEAMQESALAARLSRNDASLSPSSQTLVRPDAELRAELTNDALTAAREALASQVGEAPNAEELGAMFDAVTEAQVEVDAAVEKRDRARDTYDRALEAIALRTQDTHDEAVGGYLRAQQEQRERQARRNAES